MTSPRRKLIASIVIIVEIFAFLVMTFGLYTRFAGAGNPAGVIYILVGGVVAIGGFIVALSLVRQRVN